MDYALVHFEIPANNIKKLKRFIAEVLDWKNRI